MLRIISQDKTIDVPYESSVITQEGTENLYAYNQSGRMHIGTYNNIDCQKIMKDIRIKAYEVDDGLNFFEMPEEEVADGK